MASPLLRHLTGILSHEIVVQALTALRNLLTTAAHRAPEVDTGDGAGFSFRCLMSSPRAVVDFDLPNKGEYAVESDSFLRTMRKPMRPQPPSRR